MRIGIDLDEVSFGFISKFFEFHNTAYGTSLMREDCWTFDLHDVFGCSNDEMDVRMQEFYKTQYFRDIAPMPGAVEGMDFLNRNQVESFIVTARSLDLKDYTIERIAAFFPEKFRGIYFAPHGVRSKVVYCRNLHLDYLLEDNLDYAKECRHRTPVYFLILLGIRQDIFLIVLSG